MQEKSTKPEAKRRSNSLRTAEMRTRLMQAAREIFVEKGFAETGTPEIVKRAKVTRGALYHHFEDKRDLFKAVVQAETDQLARDIDARTAAIGSPEEALRIGTEAYFASMAEPGRCKILLEDGPAVLGLAEMSVLHAAGGRSTLVNGITRARPDVPQAEVLALAVSLSAAYDRAAFAISEGEAAEPYIKALMTLVQSAMTA